MLSTSTTATNFTTSANNVGHVHLSNTLNWTAQTKAASTKAQQTLGVVRRNLKLTFMQYPAIHTNYIISHCTTLQYNHNI